MEPEAYCLFAFGDMEVAQKLALLDDMVAGRRPVDVYWPLVGQVFRGIPDREKPELDVNSILARLRLRPIFLFWKRSRT